MKLKELIKKFEERKTIIGNFQGYAVWWEDVKEIFEQLDEPQPIKIPQCVADVIEDAREKSPELEDALHYACSNGSQEFTEWYQKKSNRDLFARAWLDGYEVEKEKRYEVILCNGQSLKTVYRQGSNHLDFEMVYGDLESFTRKQLQEANFGWVFDCPGIEMEEVE